MECGTGAPANKDEPKGILKRGRTSRQRRGIVWDEEGIAEYARTKPERMRIDEPKTPYHHDGALSSDDDSCGDHSQGSPRSKQKTGVPDPRELVEGVKAAASIVEAVGGSEWGPEAEAAAAEERKRAKKAAFEARRKAHYNEFHVVKASKERQHMGQDQDSSSSTSE